MNRNLLLGFVGGVAFTASLVVGILVADTVSDQDDGSARLPRVIGEPLAVASVQPGGDIEAELPADLPIDTPQIGGSPVEVDEAPVAGAGPPRAAGSTPPEDTSADDPSGTDGDGGDSDGTGTDGDGSDGTGTDGTTDLTVVDGPVLAEIDVPGGLAPEVYLDIPVFPPLRFFDVCAEDTGLPGCPAGVGGTVLAPFDGGGFDSLGDFRLGARLGLAPEDVECFGYVEERTRESQRPIFVWASHPAAFDIRIYPFPIEDPMVVDIVAAGNLDPEDPEFLRFTDAAVEGRLGTSPWPRQCIVLFEHPGATTYLVQVNATSFLGETASATYTLELPPGNRPPVAYEPLGDHDVRIHVPVTEAMGAAVTVIDNSEATTCADVEAAGRDDFGQMLPRGDGGVIIDWGRQPMTGVRALGRFDPAYDAHQVVNALNLRAGTLYRVCVWWLEGPDRSFDGATIVEREMLWLTTPNTITPLIRLRSVENSTSRELAPIEYRLTSSCPGGGTVGLPDQRLDPGQPRWIPADQRPVICDYDGRAAPSAVWIRATSEAYSIDFAIPLSTDGLPRLEYALVYLSLDSIPGFGTGVLSDGSTEGPIVAFDVIYRATGDGPPGDTWSFGGADAFEPHAEDPPAIDETIRIDSLGSGVTPEGRDGIRVAAVFDRPVRLYAWLLPNEFFSGLTGGDPLCLTGTRPTMTVETFSDTHSFRLGGLCTFTRYTVVLEVEDEAGNRGVFTDMTNPGAMFVSGTSLHSDFAASGTTDGHHVGYTVQNTGPGRALTVFTTAFEVVVGSDRWDLRESSGCFSENVAGTGGFHSHGNTTVWGDEVTVTVYFSVDDAYLDGPAGCASYGPGYTTWRASVTATFTIEEFERGVRIPVVAADVTELSPDPPIQFEIVIGGAVTG